MNLKKLQKKFAQEDLEWRIQQCGNGKNGYWALVVPYITNRAIMQRLDDICGPENWKNEYKPSPCQTGYLCGISIKIGDDWVTRWDGSEVTGGGSIDKVKSTLSTSMKRAGVQWGIGRYLYDFDVCFATIEHVDYRNNTKPGFIYHENKNKKEKFQWCPPALPAWALPTTEKDINAYIEAMESADSHKNLRLIYQDAYKMATAEDDQETLAEFVKVKDEAKERLDKQLKDNEAQHEAEVEALVIKHVGIIKSAANQSAANGLTDVAIGELKALTKGELLKQAMKQIKAATQQGK